MIVFINFNKNDFTKNAECGYYIKNLSFFIIDISIFTFISKGIIFFITQYFIRHIEEVQFVYKI